MGRVQIFEVELIDRASGARLVLAGGRELGGPFYLNFVGDFVLQLFPEQVARLGRAVFLLNWRRRRATPKPGSVWRRNLGDGVNPGFRLELGLADGGRVYLEAGSTKICCDEGQGDLLIAVLESFVADADALYAVSSPSPSMNFGVAQGLRGPGLELPDWADDTLWTEDGRRK
jgi:hypothetical protein